MIAADFSDSRGDAGNFCHESVKTPPYRSIRNGGAAAYLAVKYYKVPT
jgi:hypothetical protein